MHNLNLKTSLTIFLGGILLTGGLQGGMKQDSMPRMILLQAQSLGIAQQQSATLPAFQTTQSYLNINVPRATMIQHRPKLDAQSECATLSLSKTRTSTLASSTSSSSKSSSSQDKSAINQINTQNNAQNSNPTSRSNPSVGSSIPTDAAGGPKIDYDDQDALVMVEQTK